MVRSVSIRHGMHRCVWLALLAFVAGGGWYCGRGLVTSGAFLTNRTGASAARVPALQNRGVEFAAGSPEGLWMARVKKSAPTDFPKLLDKWGKTFLDEDEVYEGRPEHALRWMFAVWLVKDPEGYLQAVTNADFHHPYWAAQVLVRLMP